MFFLPWLTENFSSRLPPAELLRRVAACLSPEPKATFTGTVEATSFTIEHAKSTFSLIKGWVEPGASGGSYLRLRHRMGLGIPVLAALSAGGMGTTALVLLVARLRHDSSMTAEKAGWPGFLPVGMLILGLLFFTRIFWAEVKMSRPLLLSLLELKPSPSVRW